MDSGLVTYALMLIMAESIHNNCSSIKAFIKIDIKYIILPLWGMTFSDYKYLAILIQTLLII